MLHVNPTFKGSCPSVGNNRSHHFILLMMLSTLMLLQVKIRSILVHSSKSYPSGFAQSPKAFDLIDMRSAFYECNPLFDKDFVVLL